MRFAYILPPSPVGNGFMLISLLNSVNDFFIYFKEFESRGYSIKAHVHMSLINEINFLYIHAILKRIFEK